MLNLFVPVRVREAMTQLRFLPQQNPDAAQPRKGKPVAELCAALSTSIEETAALLDANPALNYREMRFIHPLIGDNSIPEGLRMVELHERRHHFQIRDILSSRRFPKVA
jgi:hypothetical protein